MSSDAGVELFILERQLLLDIALVMDIALDIALGILEHCRTKMVTEGTFALFACSPTPY